MATIEENAKAYTELINRLEDVKDAIRKQNYGIAMDILYKPYPEFQITTSTELKESEGERIRKWVVDELKDSLHNIEALYSGDYDNRDKDDIIREDCLRKALAWLEKQGEQKPAENVELSVFKDKLLELFQTFRWSHKDHIPTNGEILEYVDAHIQELIDTVQKPAEWSEEDEEISKAIIKRISGESGALSVSLSSAICWVENIKDRVHPQPEQEWSEEDKDYYDAIIAKLGVTQEDAALTDNQMNFLKSLRERYTWKPSEEQMDALDRAQAELCSTEYNKPICDLIDSLKKLREE